MDSNIKKNNHYVPQFYLKNFSLDGKKVYVYRTLVSSDSIPTWKKYSIKSVAMQTHLYTSIVNGIESDEFERYFDIEYESKAKEVFEKIMRDKKLNKDDWIVVIKFIASQIVRTPLAYTKYYKLMEKTAKEVLENTLPESIKKLEKAISEKSYSDLSGIDDDYNGFQDSIRVNLNKGKSGIKVEIDINRESWLSSMKYILEKHTPVLLSHKWSIVDLHSDYEVFTSDNPVICLNYYNKENYNFGGGWGNKGSEIIFPVSSNKIIYTKVGENSLKSKLSFNSELSSMIRRFTAQNSFRYIYSRTEAKYMQSIKPREINRELFFAEKEAWGNWHRNHTEQENN